MAKIKVQAQHLQPGDIVGSGEKVIQLIVRSLRMPSNKVAVTLKKDGSQRTVQWGKYTLIGVERKSEFEDLKEYWEKREEENITSCYPIAE